jgi:chromosome segregation ATPase
MATAVRPTNKVIWGMTEAIEDHDADIAELLQELMSGLEGEKEMAKRRFDKVAQIRVLELYMLAARIQTHTSRLASLHRQARNNEYDRR